MMSLLLLAAHWGGAQKPVPTSTHARQLREYGRPAFKTEQDYDRAMGLPKGWSRALSRNCLLPTQVYGWHPAWSGSAYLQYDFALLNTVAYYAYEVDPATGGPKTVHQWRSTQLVEAAHNSGTQVELTAALFGPATGQFLQNPKARRNLCDSLLSLLQYKDADGVCLDFQGLQPRHRKPFVDFVDSLAATLRAWRAGATITVTLPPHDPEGAYDIAALSPLVNRFVLLSYDLRSADDPVPGPLLPLRGSARWGERGFTQAIHHYVDAGLPKAKLIAAVPYFGYRWAEGGGTPGTTVFLRNYEAADSGAFLVWDSSSTTGWLPGAKGRPSQLWIDQVSSLGEKFTAVQDLGIGGVGIWALGYDQGQDRYWELVKGKFADCGAADRDNLASDADKRHQALKGETSAERNTWNWVWMLLGGIAAVAIMWGVKRLLK